MHRWGEADDIVTFDGKLSSRATAFATMEVALWRATDETDVTAFNTLGMSELRMPGANYLTELNLGYRGLLSPEDEFSVAAFLANITEYPFANNLKLDWWERLADVPRIPAFPQCHQVLFAPSFAAEDLSWLDTPDERVKIAYVIPLTPRENHILAEHGQDAFLAYVEREEVDLFSPRFDPPAAN